METTQNTDIVTPVPTASSLEQINETIKTTIADSIDRVKNLVIDGFVNTEINRRADLLTKLVTAINAFAKEQVKIKPDVISYDDKGQVIRQEWSKAKVDEKKKFSDKLAKAQKAFDNALGNNDYSNVENIIKELSVKSDNQKPKDNQDESKDS